MAIIKCGSVSKLTITIFEDREALKQYLVNVELKDFFVFLVDDFQLGNVVDDVHHRPKVSVIDSSAVIIDNRKGF